MINGPDAPVTEMPKHVEVCYTDAIRNLIFLKQQQVTVTNYAIAAYAGMVALASNRSVDLSSNKLAYVLVVIVTLCAFGFNAYFLSQSISGMKKHRRRLSEIYEKYFTPQERSGLQLEDAAIKPSTLTWGLGVLSFLGAVLTLAVICDL